MEYKALVTYKGGGTQYTFPFLYLRKKFVKVSYQSPTGDVTNLEYERDYKVEEKTIKLTIAGNAEDTIIIYRRTPTEQIVDYIDSTILRAYHLNINQIQLLHILEEQQDSALLLDDNHLQLRAWGRRITDLADPVNDKDAVNKQYFLSELYKRALTLADDDQQWEGEQRRLTNVADPVNGQDAITLSFLTHWIDKIHKENALIDDFFDIDVNGGLEPAEKPTYSREWELDSIGNVMPK